MRIKILAIAVLLCLLTTGIADAHEFEWKTCYLEHSERYSLMSAMSRGTSRVILKACLEHANIHGHFPTKESIEGGINPEDYADCIYNKCKIRTKNK